MMSPKPAFVIDLDDTLVTCGVHYEATRRRFFEYMSRFGMPEQEAAYRFNWLELHRQMNANLTFQHYFPDNMVKVYREWCLDKQQAAAPEIEQEIKDIGYSVYQNNFEALPGAHELLAQLRETFVLYLYSKGEESIQVTKILRANLDQYFTGCWFTDKKTARILTRFMLNNKLTIGRTWVLGNSPAGDIVPAREVGIPANQLIWLDGYMWEGDRAPLPEGIHRVTSLAEVLPLTKKLALTL